MRQCFVPKERNLGSVMDVNFQFLSEGEDRGVPEKLCEG